jgi:hypothetical protein
MNRCLRFIAVIVGVLLSHGIILSAFAAEPSGCLTCHLDKKMLVKNLTVVKAKKSAMQSGSG